MKTPSTACISKTAPTAKTTLGFATAPTIPAAIPERLWFQTFGVITFDSIFFGTMFHQTLLHVCAFSFTESNNSGELP